MSYTAIYVHCVWPTKNRIPLLVKDKRDALFDHILENGMKRRISIDCINGYNDHIHCLIQLGARQCIADLIHSLKGESAYWANKIKLFDQPLYWAKGYYAASIDESKLPIVRVYIGDQENHHGQNVEVNTNKYFLGKGSFMHTFVSL